MPVLSLACHLPHNTPNIPSRYNNEQTTKQTKAINNSYIYIYHVNVTQTVPDISPLMPMHQDPLLVCFFFNVFFLKSKLWPVDCGLSMWGKIMIPMYRLWLHGLYGLYGPRCPLSPERPLNLITHSLLSNIGMDPWHCYQSWHDDVIK